MNAALRLANTGTCCSALETSKTSRVGQCEQKRAVARSDSQLGHPQLRQAATGIDGLDAIMEGGLPAGRPTLLCGAAGCGKTLFGVTFLAEGSLRFGEPGVLISFEERPQDISENVASLGYDLPRLIAETAGHRSG
jgi:predicted ATP-dependent serine protease